MHGGQFVFGCQPDDQIAMKHCSAAFRHDQTTIQKARCKGCD